MSDSNQSTALASLTATYTDSDASDDESQTHNSNANAGESKSNRSLSRLVSYTVGDEAEIEEGEENEEASMPYWIPKKDVNPAPPVQSTPIDLSVLFTNNEEDDIILPPEPPGRCSAQLQEKIARLYDKKMREGKDMNASIQRRKDFRNPSIYEKLITFCLIDELGTNYPPEVYNPHGFAKESFYEELAKVQDEEERKNKEKTKVEFVSGTKKTAAALPLQAANDASTKDNKKRKSKWDVGASQTAAMPAVIKPLLTYPPGIVPVTTTASGTKATVISAFGTITKKSKQ